MFNEEKLKILMVEHSEADAEKILQLLVQSGFQLDYIRVSTIVELHDALLVRNWDVILSDYHLPQLHVEEVLCIIKEQNLDIPLIVVSGRVDEEAAAHIMALGAYDFMMKKNLARLVPVIRRSLHEVDNYQRLIVIQNALQKSETLF